MDGAVADAQLLPDAAQKLQLSALYMDINLATNRKYFDSMRKQLPLRDGCLIFLEWREKRATMRMDRSR